MKTKISAGSSSAGGALCIYDEDGNAIAKFSGLLLNKEKIALEIVKAVNAHGGISKCHRAETQGSQSILKEH
jgi:hypothetical protein